MRPLFAPSGRARLAWLLRHAPLLAFDWDGTLVPLAERTSEAGMSSETRALFRRVSRRWPTAIVSGRSRRDLRVLAAGLGAVALIGNHGMEGVGRDRRTAAWGRVVKGWRPALRGLEMLPGVHVEDKRLSVSVHFRDAPDVARARHAIVRVASTLADARPIPGKAVLNLVPADAPDKGAAVLALSRRLGSGAILFVGDDVTDEAGFRIRQGPPLMGVRVGRREASAARWFVRSQADVHSLLDRLA